MRYLLQFNDDFKNIYKKERGFFWWGDALCQDILSTVPTRIGDDYVYEFESEHKLSCALTYRAKKIAIDGRVFKNREGEIDYLDTIVK